MAGRADLADLTRHDRERARVPGFRKALAAPTGKIRPHHVVGAEFDVHLEQNPPATRTPTAVVVVERSANEARQGALGSCMPRELSRRNSDLTVEDLRPHVLCESEEVLVAGWAARRLHACEYSAKS